jgi:hypothetical protein
MLPTNGFSISIPLIRPILQAGKNEAHQKKKGDRWAASFPASMWFG